MDVMTAIVDVMDAMNIIVLAAVESGNPKVLQDLDDAANYLCDVLAGEYPLLALEDLTESRMMQLAAKNFCAVR